MWQINHPAYWWAFLAMVIPIVIHLYNRRRTQVKLMGSLRWLDEVQAAKWNFRRIHQWPLLLIRLLLLTVVVWLLLDVFRKDTPGSPEKLHALILIHPVAGDTTQYRQLAAGWQNDSVKVHWLAPGFPAAAGQVNPSANTIWSLLAEASLRFPADSIHIIAPNQQMYFNGKPPLITAALSWELTDIPGDSLRLLWAREGNTEPELLWFRTQADQSAYKLQKGLQNSPAGKMQVAYSADKKQLEVKQGTTTYQVPVTISDTLIVAALVDEGKAEEWQVVQKAIQAIDIYHEVPVKFTDETTTKANWLLLFSSKPAQSFTPGQERLVFRYEPGKSVEWLEAANINNLVIRKELTTAQVLEGGFLEALRPHILAFKYKQAAPSQADYRKINLAAGKREGENKHLAALPEPIQQKAGNERLWVGIISLLILTLERLWPKKVQ